MRFGICSDWKNAKIIKDSGFDYIELSLNHLVEISEQELDECQAFLNETGVKAETFNCFFPGTVKLIGPQADPGQIRQYVSLALGRAKMLGGEVAVMGSGGARRKPDGMTEEEYDRYLIPVLRMMGDEAEKVGMTVAIEPLNPKETNRINTVPEALEMAGKVNHPHVKVLADFYHVYQSGERLEDIARAGDRLFHVHIATADDKREIPGEKDLPDLQRYAKVLQQCGYHNRISIEGAISDFAHQAPIARKLFKVFE